MPTPIPAKRRLGAASLRAALTGLALSASACASWAALPAGVTCKVTTLAPKTAAQKSLEAIQYGRWESFEERDVTLNGLPAPETSTRYHLLMKRPGQALATDKPLVLFLHGFPEFSWSWEGWLKQFGAEHDSIAIDLKGFGSSAKPIPLAAYDIKRLADELDEVVKCLGYSQVIPVAHDWGGTLGWTYAMAHPEHLKALVILSTPHPYTYSREASDPQSEQRQRAKYIDQIRENTPKSMLAFISNASKDSSLFGPFYKGLRTNRLVSANMNTLAKWDRMFSYYRAMDYPPKPENFPAEPTPEALQTMSVNVPTLAYTGTNDIYFSPKSWLGVEAFVPQLQLRTIEGAGHFIDHDVPELPGQVLEFINSVTGK
jgi:pimeloyl-ACP methyl ester carboxylesterase